MKAELFAGRESVLVLNILYASSVRATTATYLSRPPCGSSNISSSVHSRVISSLT